MDESQVLLTMSLDRADLNGIPQQGEEAYGTTPQKSAQRLWVKLDDCSRAFVQLWVRCDADSRWLRVGREVAAERDSLERLPPVPRDWQFTLQVLVPDGSARPGAQLSVVLG